MTYQSIKQSFAAGLATLANTHLNPARYFEQSGSARDAFQSRIPVRSRVPPPVVALPATPSTRSRTSPSSSQKTETSILKHVERVSHSPYLLSSSAATAVNTMVAVVNFANAERAAS